MIDWKYDYEKVIEKDLNILFLDIDGVLNSMAYFKTQEHQDKRFNLHDEIDESKVRLLKKIVDATESKIVLSSTWRHGWEKNINDCDGHGTYLNSKLAYSGLKILDKTKDFVDSEDRGGEILEWVKRNNITEYIVIDDEIFKDFEELGIVNRLVKTTFYRKDGGLQQEHINKAIKLFE